VTQVLRDFWSFPSIDQSSRYQNNSSLFTAVLRYISEQMDESDELPDVPNPADSAGGEMFCDPDDVSESSSNDALSEILGLGGTSAFPEVSEASSLSSAGFIYKDHPYTDRSSDRVVKTAFSDCKNTVVIAIMPSTEMGFEVDPFSSQYYFNLKNNPELDATRITLLCKDEKYVIQREDDMLGCPST